MSYSKSSLLTDTVIGTSTGTKAVQRANSYKYFTTYKGMPPDGEPGIFLGWDKEHNPWTLVWQPEDGIRDGFWGAVGWEKDPESAVPDRAMYRALKDDHADMIVEWAFSPVCPPMKVWVDEAGPIRQDSWARLNDWRDNFTGELYKKSALVSGIAPSHTKRGK